MSLRYFGFKSEGGELSPLSHTLSLFTSLSRPRGAGPEMLHVIFEVNKVHFNDKTSQSSERGGSKDRQHINTESLTECVEGLVRLDYRDTLKHM